MLVHSIISINMCMLKLLYSESEESKVFYDIIEIVTDIEVK